MQPPAAAASSKWGGGGAGLDNYGAPAKQFLTLAASAKLGRGREGVKRLIGVPSDFGKRPFERNGTVLKMFGEVIL